MKINFLEENITNEITMSYDEYKDNNKLKHILDNYGFAVIDNILSVDEQNDAEQLMKSDLVEAIDMNNIKDKQMNKTINKIIDSDKLIWPRASIPGLIKKGFLSIKGLPHGRFAWKLRLNEKCKEIYTYLHDHKKLVVSFDMPFFSPRDSPIYETEIYPHADQDTRYLKGPPNSYQGILYVWDSTEDKSSNTAVWPMSHKNEYETLIDNIKCDNNHSMHINCIENDKVRVDMLNKWKTNARRVPVKAGSLLIFNSKLIHQGYTNGPRLAQTLAWEPKIYRDTHALNKKLELMYEGYGTTHWASIGIKHGASRLRERAQIYSEEFHKCVIPLKKIKAVPFVDNHKNKQKIIRNYKNLLKPGYLTNI